MINTKKILISILVIIVITGIYAFNNPILKNALTLTKKAPGQNIITQSEKNTDWPLYTGKTFSFNYPRSWADPKVTTLSPRTEINIEGNMVVSDGSYYSQNLKREFTYQEYINSVISSDIKTKPYKIDGLTGVYYIKDGNAGESLVNIILSDKPTSKRIFSIIYESPVSDVANIDSILDPILATFKILQ